MIREPIYHRSNQAQALAAWLLWLWLPILYGTHLAMILEALAPGGGAAAWEASDLVHSQGADAAERRPDLPGARERAWQRTRLSHTTHQPNFQRPHTLANTSDRPQTRKSERSATRIPLNRTKTVLDSLATHPIHPSFHRPRILANTLELLKTRQEHRARLAQRVPSESGRSSSAFSLNITQNTLAQLGAFMAHAGTSNSGQGKPSTGLSASTSTLQLRTMPTPPHPLPLSTARPLHQLRSPQNLARISSKSSTTHPSESGTCGHFGGPQNEHKARPQWGIVLQYRARNEEQHRTSNSHIFLAELIERGTGRALARLSKQFVSFSPMFKVFSTQIYRHSILNNPHFQWHATYCHWTWLRNIADLIQCSSICWPEHLPSGAPPLPPLAVGQSSVRAALSGRGILGKTVQGVLNIEC
ncbi:hypothetical protein BJV77DRAFT_963575 [Russula vinacea]|nr:hypothetical protein BJV77DRAFT_963575 [Russula vinacea]